MASTIFLTAEWRNLVMANYAINPTILKDYVPSNTELDFWEGKCYVSLVGFMFRQVRIRGIKIPFHVNFPEVNLRFYVRYKKDNEWRRGVVFISEIVPKPTIVFIANQLFREKYKALPMKHILEDDKQGNLKVEYAWRNKKRWNSIGVKAEAKTVSMVKGSKEEFILEHYWGYTLINSARTGEYQVQHPRWNIHQVSEYNVDCDFGALYGPAFSHLEKEAPTSVFLGEGSPIKVFTKTVL